jgi:hypothetical protein
MALALLASTAQPVSDKCRWVAHVAEATAELRDSGRSLRVTRAAISTNPTIDRDTAAGMQSIAGYVYAHPEQTPTQARAKLQAACLAYYDDEEIQ